MGRSRAVAAVATAVVLLSGACHYEASDDDTTTAATDDSGALAVQTVRATPRPLVASGTAADVCAAAFDEIAADADASATEVLDEGDFDAEAVRWVICGNVDAAEVVSARTIGGDTNWSLADIPVASPTHAGDALDVTIEDASRAWATDDTLEGEGHTHVWTTDGGVTWFKIAE